MSEPIVACLGYPTLLEDRYGVGAGVEQFAAAGVTRDRVVVTNASGVSAGSMAEFVFEPRRVPPLSLSYDHRVIDNAAAVRFTTHLKTLSSEPAPFLL